MDIIFFIILFILTLVFFSIGVWTSSRPFALTMYFLASALLLFISVTTYIYGVDTYKIDNKDIQIIDANQTIEDYNYVQLTVSNSQEVNVLYWISLGLFFFTVTVFVISIIDSYKQVEN